MLTPLLAVPDMGTMGEPAPLPEPLLPPSSPSPSLMSGMGSMVMEVGP
jgi:hypothetical protein